MEQNYSPLPDDVMSTDQIKRSSLKSKLNPTVLISLSIAFVGIVAGYMMLRGPVNKPNLAADQPPVGESCSEAEGKCSMDDDSFNALKGNPSWEWEFVITDAGGVFDRSGKVKLQEFSSLKKFSGGPYTCQIDLYRDGVKYDPASADACVGNPQTGSLLCENCSCKMLGELSAKQLPPDQLGRIAVQTKWTPVEPIPPQCENVANKCAFVRVFSTKTHGTGTLGGAIEIVPPSPYSCVNPHPVLNAVMHQSRGDQPREYEFVAEDSNGNLMRENSCVTTTSYACPRGEGSCGLFDDPDVMAPPSLCNNECNFNVSATGQDGGSLGDNGLRGGACADPNEFVRLSLLGSSNNNVWQVAFGDDIDKADDHQYNTPSARHKYIDYGVFKISVQCQETGQICRKILKMGCEGPTPSLTPSLTPSVTPTKTPTPSKSPTPSVTITPSPTLAACPVVEPINLTFELKCQGECGLSPTPTP